MRRIDRYVCMCVFIQTDMRVFVCMHLHVCMCAFVHMQRCCGRVDCVHSYMQSTLYANVICSSFWRQHHMSSLLTHNKRNKIHIVCPAQNRHETFTAPTQWCVIHKCACHLSCMCQRTHTHTHTARTFFHTHAHAHEHTHVHPRAGHAG